MKDMDIIEAVRRAARQEQFLDVVSREEAGRRFHAAVPHKPLAAESVDLASHFAESDERNLHTRSFRTRRS